MFFPAVLGAGFAACADEDTSDEPLAELPANFAFADLAGFSLVASICTTSFCGPSFFDASVSTGLSAVFLAFLPRPRPFDAGFSPASSVGALAAFDWPLSVLATS